MGVVAAVRDVAEEEVEEEEILTRGESNAETLSEEGALIGEPKMLAYTFKRPRAKTGRISGVMCCAVCDCVPESCLTGLGAGEVLFALFTMK